VTFLKVLTDEAGGAIHRDVGARWNDKRDDPIKDEAFQKVCKDFRFARKRSCHQRLLHVTDDRYIAFPHPLLSCFSFHNDKTRKQ
jgi:hypothetical protein